MKATSEESKGCRFMWYIVVISTVSGTIIGIFFSYIFSCSRRRCLRNKNHEAQVINLSTRNKILTNKETETNEGDPTYQELNLTKMNQENNYQSLDMKGNTDINDAGDRDDATTYTELDNVRDAENNYESLS